MCRLPEVCRELPGFRRKLCCLARPLRRLGPGLAQKGPLRTWPQWCFGWEQQALKRRFPAGSVSPGRDSPWGGVAPQHPMTSFSFPQVPGVAASWRRLLHQPHPRCLKCWSLLETASPAPANPVLQYLPG